MATTQNRVVNVSDQLYYNGIGPLDAKLTPVRTSADLPMLAAHEGMVIMVLDEQREYKFIRVNGELTWVKNVDTSDLSDKIDAEIARSIEADEAISTKLDEEIARSTDTDNLINGKVDAEIERAKNAEDVLEDKIINLSGNTDEKIREVLEHSDEQDQTIMDEMRKFVLSDVEVDGVRSTLVPEYDAKGELIANVGKLTLYAENIPFKSGNPNILSDIVDAIKEDVSNLSASTESEIKRLDDKIITEFGSSTSDYLDVDVVPGESVNIAAKVISIDDAGDFVTKAILKNSGYGVEYVYTRREDLDQDKYLGWEDANGNIRYTEVEPVVGSSLVIYDENFQDVDILETESVETDSKTGLIDAHELKTLLITIDERLNRLELMIKKINGGDIL